MAFDAKSSRTSRPSDGWRLKAVPVGKLSLSQADGWDCFAKSPEAAGGFEARSARRLWRRPASPQLVPRFSSHLARKAECNRSRNCTGSS